MLSIPEIACAIIEGLSSVREDEELQDFVVEVEGKEFKCHRLILSACSGFFRGLLRSGMKESQKQRTKLEGVSMETFAAILETLYTGSFNLSCDNMLSVWLAADQLQITVVFDHCVDYIASNIYHETVISVWEVASQLMHTNIIDFCEAFLIRNTCLENWKTIYSTAIALHSELILSHVRDFVMKNFEHVIKSEAFLCLGESDLITIIQSQDLVVSSEDVVVDSIFTWIKGGRRNHSATKCVIQSGSGDAVRIEQGENNTLMSHAALRQLSEHNNEIIAAESGSVNEDRESCLESLLPHTRLCLVHPRTLEKLSHDALVMGNQKIRDMVMDALLYKSIGRQHGLCTKAAVHRSCSGLENVGVMGLPNGKFFALSSHPQFHWLKLPHCPYLDMCTSVNVIAYTTDFFAIGELAENSCVCVFVQNEWRKVKRLSGKGWLGVAVEEFIYLINSYNRRIERLNPKLGNSSLESCVKFPTRDKIEHVCSFESFILAFTSDNVDETAVHCLDTRSQKWTRLDSLEGSAGNIVSFRKEKQLYILQINGSLWECYSDASNSVHFKFADVIWQGIAIITGVIYINECLCFILEEEHSKDEQFSITSKLFVNNELFFTRRHSWSLLVPAVIKSIAQ